MDEKEIEQMFEAFKKHIESLGLDFEKLYKTVRSGSKDEAEAKKRIAEMSLGVDKFNKNFKKAATDIESSIKKYRKQINEGAMSVEDLDDKLKSLRDQIKNTADVSKKQSLMSQKADLERLNASNQSSKIFSNSLAQMAGTVVKGVTNSFMGAAKSALQGGDALDVAGGFMQSQLDMANQATQVGTGALSTFGKATAGAGGLVGVMGVAASVAGETLGFLSNQITELAKAGIGFMISQTRKLIDGFSNLSNVGAIYSGGMMAQIKTAHEAGLTLDQFSKAVANNTEAFSKAGIGVAEGSKRMAAAMTAGGKSARDGMFALGMNMEQQADAYAQTIALMAGPSGKLRASNQEVAAETAEYAKSLKIISDITGQDAKARMEKLRQDNDTLAFNSYLNGLSETERKKTVEAMALMSEADQRAFREKQIYGTVISQDLNIARATNTAIAKNQDEQFEAARQHNLNIKTVADGYQRNSADMMKQSNELGKTLGLSQGEAAKGGANVVNATNQYAAKFGDAAKTQEIINQRLKAGTKGEAGPEVDVMEMQQKFAVEMENIASKNLPAFAKALEATMADIRKSVEALANLGASAPGMMGGMWKQIGLAVATALIPMLLQGIIGKIAGGKWGGGAGRVSGAAEEIASRGGSGGAGNIGTKIGKGMEGLGKGIGGIGKGVGDMISGLLKGLASGLSALGKPQVLLGTLALAGIGAAMWVSGKAFKEFSEIQWDAIGKGLVAVLGVGALGALAGAASEFIIPGAIALGMLGGAILLLGAALKAFPSGVIPDMSGAFEKVGDVVSGLVDIVGSAFGWIYDKISGVFSWVGDLGAKIFGGLSNVVNGFGDYVGKIFGWISDKISKVLETIGGAAKTVAGWFGYGDDNKSTTATPATSKPSGLANNTVVSKDLSGSSASPGVKNVAGASADAMKDAAAIKAGTATPATPANQSPMDQLNKQTSLLQDIHDVLLKNNKLTSGILQHSY